MTDYILQDVEEHENRESLLTLLQNLIEQHGEPSAEDMNWADRMLAPQPESVGQSC